MIQYAIKIRFHCVLDQNSKLRIVRHQNS